MKYYRVLLWGYGGEAAYIGVTKEQYKYWSDLCEEDDGVVIDYMVDPDEYLIENTVPEGMDFMLHTSGDNQWHNGWYEAPNEFAHQYGPTADCRVTVDEVESDEWNAKVISTIVDGQDSRDIEDRLMDKGVEFIEYGMLTDYHGEPVTEPDYVCQFWSAEKGTFFDGVFATEGNFDIKKLKFITQEFPNGDDTIIRVEYDGEEVDNSGAETNGKGYSVHFWSNVNG